MGDPLHFRAGSKFGITFQVRHAGNAVLTQRGKIIEGDIPRWSRVGVRSIVKDQWQDKAGVWRDSIQFYELVPDGDNNRIDCDEFFVSGPFAILRHETVPTRALEAWRDFVGL